MSTITLPRALALTLALGTTAAAMLTPAHATNGRTAAQECIDRDDCTITPYGDSGAFIITLDGGGVIYCGSVNDECVVVSPDTGKGRNPAPVAAPISKTPAPNAGPTDGRPVSSNPKPVNSKPKPVSNTPKPPKGTIGTVGLHPIPHPIFKPIGNAAGGRSGAPVLLARGGHR
jgi:hypothetical protein